MNACWQVAFAVLGFIALYWLSVYVGWFATYWSTRHLPGPPRRWWDYRGHLQIVIGYGGLEETARRLSELRSSYLLLVGSRAYFFFSDPTSIEVGKLKQLGPCPRIGNACRSPAITWFCSCSLRALKVV